MRFTRYHMYNKIFSALSLPLKGKILGISGLKYFTGSKNYKPPVKVIDDAADITEAHYPETDMCNLPYKDNVFDAVISDQVIEHIEGDIQKAVDEAHRVLKKDGQAIITSVFMHPLHWGPKDMWRFSPDALRYLCRDFSEITECDGWGNRFAHILFLLHNRSRDWQIPERRLSLKHYLATLNEKQYPLTTWIIAKK